MAGNSSGVSGSSTSSRSQNTAATPRTGASNAAPQTMPKEKLTTFSDLTDPPPAGSNHDVSLTSESTLSGIYSKFFHSPALGKDQNEEHLPSNAVQQPQSHHQPDRDDELHAQEGGPSNVSFAPPEVGRRSSAQSPSMTATDHPLRLDPSAMQTAAKGTKSSLPSPALRSPNPALAPSNVAQPSLSTFQATMTNERHHKSPSTSSGLPEDSLTRERGLGLTMEESNLRRVLAKSDHLEDPRPSRRERRFQSPPPATTRSDTRSKDVSESSISDIRAQKLDARQALVQASRDDSSMRTSPVVSSPSEDTRSPTNPLDLLAPHGNIPRPSKQDSVYKHSLGSRAGSGSGISNNAPVSDKAISSNRVNQSKLPGFHSSRTSSTDSAQTSGIASATNVHDSHFDGSKDKDHTQNTPRPGSKLRSRLLGKEYWMKDENARDCFRCSEPFTLVRRKHHCRTCGQIFDNKCTKLISGSHFDMPTAVRVCKPCEVNILSQDNDDSSDFTDDDSNFDVSSTPYALDHSDARYDDDNVSLISQSHEHISKAPTMHFPVRRANDEGGSGSAVLEFQGPEHSLQRPSSSRSLRSIHSIASAHKRQHSKHSHMRSLRNHESRVPFQRPDQDDFAAKNSLAFHRDSVIDPDLAQYLSDDASSDEEPQLRPSQSSEKISRHAVDNDRTTIGGLLAAVRKGRSLGDRTIASLLNFGNNNADDAASIISARAIDGARNSRRRTHSVASSIHLKTTPRATRDRLQLVLPNEIESPLPPSPILRSGRIMRSASMHGTGAPQLELNRASVQHVHKMLRQMLKDENVSKASSWEQALVPIFLKASDEIDPDIDHGDDIDIRSYVKLKKIPGGHPRDSSYISGVMFSKNVALKSMQRSITNPRILLLTFALEYSGPSLVAHFQSLDPVIRQEREHLQNVVSRIAALNPDVVLIQRNVSRIALELLEKANIAVAHNVRTEALEAVHRITQADFVHSLDKLSSPSIHLGTCDLFEVKTYLIEGRRKTYLSMSGCPPDLGCTIILRGGSWRTLQKIKKIADNMIYVVYNLKLETCLMRDEWAMIPSGDNLARTPSTVTSPKQANDNGVTRRGLHRGVDAVTDSGQSAGPGSTKEPAALPASEPADVHHRSDSNDIPDDLPVPTLYQDLADKHETRILSASPFVKFSQPYLLMRAREMEQRVAYFKRLRDQDVSSASAPCDKAKAQKFTLITPEMLHNPSESASTQVREIIHAVHDAEYEKALQHYEKQKSMWESVLSEGDLFDPISRQNITVSYGYVKDDGTPCEGPELQAFRFYTNYISDDQMLADMTLGQYVQRLCLKAAELCTVCGKRAQDHQHQYVHGEARVTFFTEPCPPKLRGLQDVILMWSVCKICQTETTVTPMSANTWKYSWAKYLELSFWSADLHARAGGCRHDLHRDHLRFFGFRNFAVRVHYEPIELLEVVQPKDKITWKVENDLCYKNDMYTRMEHRITRFMVSVKLRLQYIKMNKVSPEVQEACHSEIDRLMTKANDDHSMMIKRLQEFYSSSRHWKITPLNGGLRLLQSLTFEWDSAFAEIEKNFFPSERDIRRLATLQLKKIFIDRDVSITTLAPENDAPTQESEKQSETGELIDSENSVSKLSRKISPEKTQNVLRSVVEEDTTATATSVKDEVEKPGQSPTADPDPPVSTSTTSNRDGRPASADLEHLDLAVPDEAMNSTSFESPSINKTTNDTHKPSKQTPQLRHSNTDRRDINHTEYHNIVQEMSKAPTEVASQISSLARTQLPVPMTYSSQRATMSRPNSPSLTRAHSQPAGSIPQRKDFPPAQKQSTMSAIQAANGFRSGSEHHNENVEGDSSERKFSDNFKIPQLRSRKFNGQSLIPRAIASAKRDSRVSSLAKHFEQLTKEFEQARLRERQQRANSIRRPRVYPSHAPKATVQVYSSIREAVDENEAYNGSEDRGNTQNTTSTTQELADATHKHPVPHETPDSSQTLESSTNEEELNTSLRSYESSESGEKTDGEGNAELDQGAEPDEMVALPDNPEDLIRLTQEDLELDHLQKHERTSLIKLLTNFWAERSSSGWPALDYTVQQSEHVFDDNDIIIRDDELSSAIAYALSDPGYVKELKELYARPMVPRTKMSLISAAAREAPEDETSRALACDSAAHLRISLDEPVKLLVRVLFAQQFDAMRKKCGIEERFIESMSRCMKYDSKGGKSKSIFLKTLDDRFVLKSLSASEVSSFINFAPRYFDIVTETFYHTLPTCIAKMVGAYHVCLKNPLTGTDHNHFLLVMENLLYDRTPERIFDLKGSMRNRRINATGERNEVLLDENMVDFIYETPLFVREHSSKLVQISVKNDSLFLSKMNVMDYSLLVAIDEPRKELIVGIIDCIRTYTLDKKLESWIKDRGLISAVMGASAAAGMGTGVSGGKNKPTITSPRDYRRRFRQAMRMYILEAPSCWHKWDPQRDLPGTHPRALVQEDDGPLEGQNNG